MKAILSIITMTLLSIAANAQTFYVVPTDKGYESRIVEKLRYHGVKLTTNPADADYKIECFVDGRYNFWAINRMFRGYVLITDAQSGKEVARTKEVKRNPTTTNGFNAADNIMGVIAARHLISAIKSIQK